MELFIVILFSMTCDTKGFDMLWFLMQTWVWLPFEEHLWMLLQVRRDVLREYLHMCVYETNLQL